MESDAEREREVERLPWTLNLSAASLSSSRAMPPRLDFLSQSYFHLPVGIPIDFVGQEPREAQVQSSRRRPVCGYFFMT